MHLDLACKQCCIPWFDKATGKHSFIRPTIVKIDKGFLVRRAIVIFFYAIVSFMSNLYR